MGVQHHSAHERRSSVYVCQQGYHNGDTHVCQTMTARAVDAGVVQAFLFLKAVSPESLPVAMRVLDQIEHDLAGQRRQRELQLEQARYDARPAQRQYERIDPDHRVVASELERRWNEKLERVAQLEQAHAKADAEAQWDLTDALKTSADAVAQIHELAQTSTYAEIAAQMNADGWRTAHGRSFTSQHVGYICRRDGLARGASERSTLKPGA